MKSYIKFQQPIRLFKHSLISRMYTTLPIFRPNLKLIGSLQLSTCHCTRNLFLQQHTSEIHHKWQQYFFLNEITTIIIETAWLTYNGIVLYCIMRPYILKAIRPLSYRHSSGVIRNPHSTLAGGGIFNLRSMSPQGTHLLIVRRRNSITSVLVTKSWITCLSATCKPRTINLSITEERITFSQPQTSDRWISHWRALCLLAHDNWRCSIQSEIFTHQNFSQADIRSRVDSG